MVSQPRISRNFRTRFNAHCRADSQYEKTLQANMKWVHDILRCKPEDVTQEERNQFIALIEADPPAIDIGATLWTGKRYKDASTANIAMPEAMVQKNHLWALEALLPHIDRLKGATTERSRRGPISKYNVLNNALSRAAQRPASMPILTLLLRNSDFDISNNHKRTLISRLLTDTAKWPDNDTRGFDAVLEHYDCTDALEDTSVMRPVMESASIAGNIDVMGKAISALHPTSIETIICSRVHGILPGIEKAVAHGNKNVFDYLHQEINKHPLSKKIYNDFIDSIWNELNSYYLHMNKINRNKSRTEGYRHIAHTLLCDGADPTQVGPPFPRMPVMHSEFVYPSDITFTKHLLRMGVPYTEPYNASDSPREIAKKNEYDYVEAFYDAHIQLWHEFAGGWNPFINKPVRTAGAPPRLASDAEMLAAVQATGKTDYLMSNDPLAILHAFTAIGKLNEAFNLEFWRNKEVLALQLIDRLYPFEQNTLEQERFILRHAYGYNNRPQPFGSWQARVTANDDRVPAQAIAMGGV